MLVLPKAKPAKQANVVPWSISSLRAYETCPRRFKLTRIEKKVREPQTDATLWGNEVHKALENALRGTSPLAERFAAYNPIIERLHAVPGYKEAERNFALSASFSPVDYWSAEAWVRGKADVTILPPDGKTGIILDYKTGKVKDDSDQLNLFGAVLLAEKPELERVRAGYVWLQHDKIDQITVDREAVPMIWQGFAERVKRMEHSAATGDFPPRPSGLCRSWCPVGRSNCEHCGQS